MSRNNRLLGLIAATLVACGGNNNPADSGPISDVGTDAAADAGSDAGAAGVCDTPIRVTLAAGAQSVMGDTTGHTSGLLDFGTCGAPAMGTPVPQPQQAIELTLPGGPSDMVTVAYTLVNDGTDVMFDTTTQVRTSCGATSGAECFDDVDANEYRSEGQITGMGGSIQYLIVSGYRAMQMGFTSAGPYQVDFQTYVNPTPPTFTSGSATLLDGTELRLSVTGADAQGVANGVQLAFLDAASAPIGFDDDLDPTTPPITDLYFAFDPSVAGMTTFTGTVTQGPLAQYAATLGTAVSVRLSIVDDLNLMSVPEAMLPLTMAVSTHAGDPCDAMHLCGNGVDCTGTPAVCTVPAAVVTACAAATPVTIATPTTTTTSATSTINFTTGMGLLEGACVNAGGLGDDHILSVDVPATGTFDLIAETAAMGTMPPDTVLYDRTVCGDPTSETACNDDRSVAPDPAVYASLITVQNAAAGTHYIVVDAYETLMASVSTVATVRLRPVLAAGAACDPAGVNNRCAGGACPTATPVCP